MKFRSNNVEQFKGRKTFTSNIILILIIVVVSMTITGISVYLFMEGNSIAEMDKMKPSDYLNAAITVVSSLIGVVAAILAYRSILFAKDAEEGQLYVHMMERYDSAEMLSALRKLGAFRRRHSSNLKEAITRWYIELKAGDKEAEDLEDARRKLKYYYRDLIQLYQAGYFSEKWTKRILNTGGRHLFKEVVLEMDKHINKFSFEGEFDPFDKLYEELENEQKKPAGTKPDIPVKVCLIPARYDSTRFPGKLMKTLAGETVISITFRRVKKMGLFDKVIVVTNSKVIQDEIARFDEAGVIYLNEEHASGTDRIAQALKKIEADIIVNVQGDEPFVEKKSLEDILNVMKVNGDELYVSSLMKELKNEEHIKSSDYVKVVCDKKNNALFFSRSVLPYQKNAKPKATYYEHIGVYAFTRESLKEFSKMEPTELEMIESVECLRFLENGIPMKMVKTDAFILEIDTEEDHKRAEAMIANGELSIWAV